MTAELSARRKADREAMAARVADLASEYKFPARAHTGIYGPRHLAVDIEFPHGLKLTVNFDGTPGGAGPDVYVLSWYGVEDGTRLHPGMFGHVNPLYGHKATDVAHGFAQLERTLRERFAVIADGSAFTTPSLTQVKH
jgi:hypothetical protein